MMPSDHQEPSAGPLDPDPEIDAYLRAHPEIHIDTTGEYKVRHHLPEGKDSTVVSNENKKWKELLRETLDGDHENDVHGTYRDFFHRMFEEGDVSSIHSPADIFLMCQHVLNENELQEAKDSKRNDKLSRLAEIFFEELCRFIEHIRIQNLDAEGNEKMKRFAKNLSHVLIFASDEWGWKCEDPTAIIDYIAGSSLLLLASRLTTVPALQTDDLAGEINRLCTQDINTWGYHQLIGMKDAFFTMSVAGQLDFLHFLPTIIAHSRSNAQEAFSDFDDHVDDVVDSLMQEIEASVTSPIVRYGFEVSRKSIEREKQQPSFRYIPTPFEDEPDSMKEVGPYIGRVSDEPVPSLHSRFPTKLSLWLAESYAPNAEDREEKVLSIATDADGAFDHSGVLRALILQNGDRISLEKMVSDNRFFPFGNGSLEDVLLLQHLQRPMMRQSIEQEFGISLADIPLRSQIHLLRFLADKDSVIFDRLRSVLQKHPTHSKNILLSFLACSEDQEMGNIILALAAYPELLVALDRYGDMAKNAEALTANLASLTHGTGKSQFDSLHFYRQLIVQSNRTLRDAVRMIHESPEKAEEVGQLCADHVRFSQDRVGLLHAMVRTLPRAEVTSMDLIKLPLVTITEGLVSEIGVSPAVRGMTRAAFPSAKDQQEFAAFIKREGAVLTVSLCEDHALGMFGSEPLVGGRVRHIDWYCTNKAGPVRGLAEPTLRTALSRIDVAQMLTCVATPEASSCETFIENAGMVACGVTEPGEYEGQYLRLRRVSSDAGLHSRTLRPEQIDVLRTLAQNGNGQVVRSDIDGTEYAACIAESDSVETFFNNARHQLGDGTWVMSRQIREPSSESKKVRYLCIFEHDRASDEERETIHRAFDEFRTRQRLAAEDSQSSSNAIRNIDTME